MKKLAIVKCGEKGFVLILALVAMLALTLIGLSLIMNITTDVQLARNEKESMLAFQLAEAGVREASARLHLPSTNANYIGEIVGEANYRSTLWTKSFVSGTAVAGTLPASQSYTVTLTYLDESNPEKYCDSNNTANADGLNSGVTTDSFFSVTPSTDQATCNSNHGIYNTAAATCTWTCSNSPAEIVMYGQDFNLSTAVTPIQYGTLPVYKISSVATVNGTNRTVEAYLGESNLNTDTLFGINTNGCVTSSGAGTSSQIKTDVGGAGQIVQNAGCAVACPTLGTGTCATPKTTLTNLTTYLGDTIPNIKAYADQVINCNNAACAGGNVGSGWTGNLSSTLTSLGNQAANEGVLLVVDNAGGVAANLNGSVANGEGILIVTGNLTISGNFNWQGMIYVLGNLTITGTPNIKGGIMAGNTAGNTVALNGNVTVNYSKEELAEMARQTSSTATVAWKRF